MEIIVWHVRARDALRHARTRNQPRTQLFSDLRCQSEARIPILNFAYVGSFGSQSESWKAQTYSHQSEARITQKNQHSRIR